MVWRQVRTYAELVKFEHTVFALPFAYSAALLAARGWPTAPQLFWITMAMVGGRTAAMAFNRLIDASIDARNPRTSGRHLPRGILNHRQVAALGLASLALLGLSAWMLNPLCVLLFPVAVALLALYPYTKRFTWGCHFALGAAQFAAPVGAWIAVTGQLQLEAILLGLAAGLWVAGFDIIYATQDYDFDRQAGIFSLPAIFGLGPALWAARFVHMIVVLLFAAFAASYGLGPFFYGGTAVLALLLAYEHSLVRPDDLSRVNAAFFNVNGAISLLLLVFTVLEVGLGGLAPTN